MEQPAAFQQITVADWNDSKGRYFDAPAANWVEGLGLTCDNPLADVPTQVVNG